MRNISSETDFENHIREDILSQVLEECPELSLFDFKKAVDILISKNGDNPKLYFIEIKYHKKSHGRLGFGHGDGAGFQPEVLKRKVDYFEKNLMWILGNENMEGYWLVNNKVIREYLSGGQISAKYNGIQLRFFDNVEMLSKVELLTRLKCWMTAEITT